jgi:hypothetical protein
MHAFEQAGAQFIEDGKKRSVLSSAEKVLLAVFLLFAIVFSIVPLRNQIRHGTTKDYPLWLDTGERELHGITPYYFDPLHHEFPFMYPPGAAGLLALAVVFGKVPMIMLFVLLNSTAWAVCIAAPIYLVSGRVRGQPLIFYWVPSLVCILYIWSTYLEGQIVVILLACLLGMFVCLRRRQNAGAGLLLALAAGFKAFPILAVFYLIYRRYWKALAYTGLFLAVTLLVLPACFRGPRGAVEDMHTWLVGMPDSYTPDRIGQRQERSYTWQNGSLISVTNRLLRHIIADRDPEFGPTPVYVNIADLSFAQVNRIIVILGLALGLAYLAVMPKTSLRTSYTDAVESSALLIMIIIFTPLSFTYNNAWLMPAIVVVLYEIAFGDQSPAHRRLVMIWLAASLIPLIFTIRTPPFRIARAVGNTFWSNMLLLAELGWLLLWHRRQASAPHPSPIRSDVHPRIA